MSNQYYKVKQRSNQYLVILCEENYLGEEEEQEVVFTSWSKKRANFQCEKLNRRLRNVEGAGEPT